MGGKGDQAQDVLGGSSALGTINRKQAAMNNPQLAGLMSQYGQGQMGYGDAVKQAQGLMGPQGNIQDFNDQLATGATTGSKYATEQVQNNPILGQLFGQGGELSQAVGKEQELQGQGFKLQPQDVEAYGQASGNISRLFGQGENRLAQSLAQRGLSSGRSGAAGAQFSGLMGNKNEQLAKAQMDIANQRMQNTMQRIGQQQSFVNSLGGQAQNAIQGQYGRQLSGVQEGRAQTQQGLNAAQAEQDQANKAFDQQQATKGPGFGDIAGGLLGAAGSAVLGPVAGMAGGALAKSLFGGSKGSGAPNYEEAMRQGHGG